MAMTKADIVDRIYKEVGFSKKEAAELVDLVFKVIKETLGRGEKVNTYSNPAIISKGFLFTQNTIPNILTTKVLPFLYSLRSLKINHDQRRNDSGRKLGFGVNLGPKWE